MNGGLFSFSLPVGRLAGVFIRIHWTLLLLWAFDLNRYLEELGGTPALVSWGVHAGAVFGSILLHEYGHCFAARAVGGRADEILLWPLGGLAFCECPQTWRANLIVAAGGPAVTILIIALSALVFSIYDPPRTAVISFYLARAERVLLDWNVLILIFNLIPLYPMDGGRIFHALAWGWFGRHGAHPLNGYARASKLTLRVSWVTAALGIVLAIYMEQPQIAVLLVLMVLESGTLRRGG
jgi:Zn-dependent protease